MKKILTIMALLIAFTVNGFAKDITIYVHSSQQPSIYAWNNDGNLTGDFPGYGMAWVYWTSGKNLWKYTFENQSTINFILSYDGHQTADILDVTEDTYYDFNPSDGSYQVLANSSVDQVALPGSFNNWNQSFYLTKGTGNTWTAELDLTETTADVTFKSIIFSGSNNAWLGYNSPGISFSTPDGWLVDDGTDNHNIKLNNSTTGYQTYTITLTWEENPFYSSNWTISVEGKDKRVTYDEIPLTMDGAALVSTEFDGYSDDVIVKLTISNNTDPYVSRNGWEIGRITNVDNWESNDYMISLSGKDGVEFDIFTTVGALKNTAKLGTDEYVAGQYHPQGGVTINVYNQCSLKSISILVPIVSSAKLLGSWDEWGDGLTLIKAADSYEWTGTLDLTDINSDAAFKLLVNGESWLGSTQVALAEGTENLVSVGEAGSNLTLNNSSSGYATYDVTATWTISSTVTSGWTLKIVGKDERIEDYYVIGDNGTKWVALGKMNYYAPMEEYDYTLDNTWTGKYFAIAPASALNSDGDVVDWSKVVRPETEEGNWLVELRQYSGVVVINPSAEIDKVVWEKSDEITNIDVVYYINQGKFALYPESEVTISSAGYATYSNKYAYQIQGAGVEVSIVTAVTTAEAVMTNLTLYTDEGDTHKEYNIPAGTGVIVKGTGSFWANPYATNAFDEYVDVTGNMLIGSGNTEYVITGKYNDTDEYRAFILADGANGVGFYILDGSDNVLAPHKAFLAVPKTGSAPQFIGFGGTTGIDATLNDNGQMINDNVIYDLSGRRVMNPTKGLYIINGKKVVIK